MEINLTNVIYLFMRLSPIIIVGYFVLQSIFESSLKGVFYLAGLLITLVVTILASRLEIFKPSDASLNCKGITLGNGQISYLPLSQSTLIYTLSYLMTIVSKYKTWPLNMGSIILLIVLSMADFMWNLKQGCMSIIPNALTTWLIAGTIGVVWTSYLLKTGYDVTFFFGVSDANVCKMNNSNFRCRLKK